MGPHPPADELATTGATATAAAATATAIIIRAGSTSIVERASRARNQRWAAASPPPTVDLSIDVDPALIAIAAVGGQHIATFSRRGVS